MSGSDMHKEREACTGQPSGAEQSIKCLISAEQIEQKVTELARRISADYQNKDILVIGVLKGAWVFMADLVRKLTIPVKCDFVMLSSYGARTVSSGEVKMLLDVRTDPAGKDVLIVEDIVDTGLSMPVLIEHLSKRGPASIRLCALLDKPARRKVPVTIDYLGFTIPDKFVVGYGIDWAERYRELPFIGYIEQQ